MLFVDDINNREFLVELFQASLLSTGNSFTGIGEVDIFQRNRYNKAVKYKRKRGTI